MKGDGGPAFPSPQRTIPDKFGAFANDKSFAPLYGMTLRDYFAAHCVARSQVSTGLTNDEQMNDGAQLLARFAYMTADAMLIERAK